MLEFLKPHVKQQGYLKHLEKQRQEDLKQQEKQRKEDLKKTSWEHWTKRRNIRETTRMFYTRKRSGKFKYILARVGNKFSWGIYLQTWRRSDIRGIFQKVRINFWKRLWKLNRREKNKTFIRQIRDGRTWKIRKFYSAEVAQGSEVPRNYPNTNENTWVTKFTV